MYVYKEREREMDKERERERERERTIWTGTSLVSVTGTMRVSVTSRISTPLCMYCICTCRYLHQSGMEKILPTDCTCALRCSVESAE